MTWMIVSLLFNFAFAQTSTPPPAAPPGTSGKAYELAKQKKWPEARTEAVNATKSNPNDGKAWFMLGLVEERTENLSESAAAYKKYLAMNPDPKVAATISAKVPDLEKRARKKSEAKYNNDTWGLFLGYSPSVQSTMADQLDSDFKTTMDIGMNFGSFIMGYRRGYATIPKFKAPPIGVTTGTLVYTTITDGKQSFGELYVAGLIPMIPPYDKWGGAQLGLPLFFGMYSQNIKAGDRNFGNIAYDLATGLSVKWFTRSPFTVELAGLYHLAIPFWGVRESSGSKTIRSMKDEDIQGRNSGLELRIGIGLLFGSEPKGHY